MIDRKCFTSLVAIIVSVAVIACLVSIAFADQLSEQIGSNGVSVEYENQLFDTASILEIDITIDADSWNTLLENAINEEYYSCTVSVNGTDFDNVGIRAKGNTSLSSIANDDTTDRYSFKLEFDHYVESQTCFGLDKLILNNNYADATNMKEAIVYDMFAFLDTDASLYNYAKISVNGEYWGIYLALEAVEDSFLLRNYGAGSGELYKPDSMNFGGAGGMKDRTRDELDEMEQRFFGNTDDSEDTDNTGIQNGDGMQAPDGKGGMGHGMQFDGQKDFPDGESSLSDDTQTGSEIQQSQIPEGDFNPVQAGQDLEPPQTGGDFQDPGNGGGQGDASGGADLNYIDDDLDSYSTIWEGEVSSTSKKDHTRVVEALKNISQRNDLEAYMDVDNLLKYLAVHTFAVNLDSLSGTMAHNYYLYEDDGQLNLLPWDYNLAWGGFQSGNASSTINFPIDTPFTSGLDTRDFFAALLENEEYLAQYHEYLRQLCQYVTDGQLDTVYQRIRAQIDSLVETDPNAFYSYEEYDAAAQMLRTVLDLRAQSVSGQLDGSIPSTTDAQKADSSSLVDVSNINLSTMGGMNHDGGGQGGMDMANAPDAFAPTQPEGTDAPQTDSTDNTQPDNAADTQPENTAGFVPGDGTGTPPDNATGMPPDGAGAPPDNTAGAQTGGAADAPPDNAPDTPQDGNAGMLPPDDTGVQPDNSTGAQPDDTTGQAPEESIESPADGDATTRSDAKSPFDENGGQMPAGKFQGGAPNDMRSGHMAADTAGSKVQPAQLFWLGISLLAIAAALLLAKCYRRRRKS